MDGCLDMPCEMTLEAIMGFGDMAATADTAMMRGRGIADSKFSRSSIWAP